MVAYSLVFTGFYCRLIVSSDCEVLLRRFFLSLGLSLALIDCISLPFVLLARLAFDASLFMSLSRAVDAIQRWIGLGILSNLCP